jgi:hypothetical protein
MVERKHNLLMRRDLGGALAAAALVFVVPFAVPLTAQSAQQQHIVAVGNGSWTVPLNGPWKFRLGDDLRWASPQFDDSSWKSLDLAPVPGSHDPDVGLSGYVRGWAATGYPNQIGFAWYRLRVSYDGREPLLLLGPVLVDNAYQIYVNGLLVGGIGDFSHDPPTAYGIHPIVFPLPTAAEPNWIAIRTWRAPIDRGDSEGGGIHIAPVLGNATGIHASYVVQWWERVRGELPELIPIAAFLCLAMLAFTLARFSWRRRGLIWLGTSLILTAVYRGDLVMFWCSGIESIATFELISGILLLPATLGAWILTSYELFGVGRRRIPLAVGMCTALYCLCEIVGIYGLASGTGLAVVRTVVMYDRYALLLIFLFIMFEGVRLRRFETLYILPALLAVAVGQFASELSRLGIPGIWFPYDTGVSLSNYAYTFAAPLFLILLLHDLSEIGSVAALFQARTAREA